jgi:hypothetical protein
LMTNFFTFSDTGYSFVRIGIKSTIYQTRIKIFCL